MPRTKNVPRRSEGGAVPEQQGDPAAGLAAAPAPVPAPNHDALQVAGAGASRVTIKEEVDDEEEEEEETSEGQRRDLLALAPGPARVPAPGPRGALTAAPAPAPAPHHDAPAADGAGGSGVTQVKGEEAEETLGQQRDRLALALAHGPVRVDSHIKVEDTDDENTDGGQDGEVEVGPGGEGGDGEVEEGPGEEGGLVLLEGAAHVPGDDGERGGAPRRSTPADRAARAKRGRGDVAAGNGEPDAPPPKQQRGGAQVGQSGRHGVSELTGRHLRKGAPRLKWRAQLRLPGNRTLELGLSPTTNDAARAYDAEVRRRGWAHVRALNFPQPEELAAYPQAGERCDERGLPLTLAPEPPAAAQGAAGQRLLKFGGRKPGKSGLFGVKKDNKNKAAQWMAAVAVPMSNTTYVVGYFDTKEEAARAYDAEIRRRGWTLIKRLNFPDPAGDAALPPSSAAAAGASRAV